jgi:hypothetical protein
MSSFAERSTKRSSLARDENGFVARQERRKVTTGITRDARSALVWYSS